MLVQNLKAEFDAENKGWRQALAERAKAELAAKEQTLRAQLEAERNAQLELVRTLLWQCVVAAKLTLRGSSPDA